MTALPAGAARPSLATDWAAALSTTITYGGVDSQLHTFHPGDIWFGMGARQFGNAEDLTSPGSATFSYAHVGVPPPADLVAPSTIYGEKDICAAEGLITFPSVSVVGSGAPATANHTFALRGLSVTYPYYVTITALFTDNSRVVLSRSEIHAYARLFPPFRWDVSMWLDPSGYKHNVPVTYWEDSSGNGHYVEQPDPRRVPNTRRDPVLQGPAAVLVFVRSRSTRLVGGFDAIDLGVSGNMAAYTVVRTPMFAPQIIFGRGSFDYFGNRYGWNVGISAGLYGSQAAMGMAIYDGAHPDPIYNPGAGASVPSDLYYWTTMGYHFNVQTGPTSQISDSRKVYPKVIGKTTNYTLSCEHSYDVLVWDPNTQLNVTQTVTNSDFVWKLGSAPAIPAGYIAAECRTRLIPYNITTGIPFGTNFGTKIVSTWKDPISPFSATQYKHFGGAGAFWDNFTNPVSPVWGRDVDDPLTSRSGGSTRFNWGNALGFPGPASTAFHIGAQDLSPGQVDPSGDMDRAFEGEINTVLLYRKEHSATERAAVREFVQKYTYYTCSSVRHSTSSLAASGNGQYCNPGVRGHSCYQSCPALTYPISGYEYHDCYGGTFSYGPLICARACTTYPGPRQYLTCNKTIVQDRFLTAEETRRYVLFPPTPDSVRDRMFTFDGANRWISASTNDACRQLPAVTWGIPVSNWNFYIGWGQPQRVSADLAIDEPGTIVGIVLRIWTTLSLSVTATLPSGDIRVYDNRTDSTGLLLHVPGGLLEHNVSTLGTFFKLEGTNVFTAAGNELQIRINGQWFRNLTLLNSAVLSGSAGVYVSGVARFTNITVVSTCDGGNECRMLDGQRCDYQCKPGYYMVSRTWSNGTITCRGGGTPVGVVGCVASPPTMLPQSFNVKEHTDDGKPIGIVKAMAAAAEQQMEFVIERTWGCNNRTGITPLSGGGLGCNATHYNNTFSINSCSGLLSVLQSDLLDYRYVQHFIVTVRVLPDGEYEGSTVANMTVFVDDIDDAPKFLNDTLSLSIPENYVGPFSGAGLMSLWTYDNDQFPPVNEVLLYGLVEGYDARLSFAINQNTGLFSVITPLNFESQEGGAILRFPIRTFEQRDRSREAMSFLAVTVENRNDPPRFISASVSGLVLTVKETDLVSTGSYVGVLYASDDDATASQWPGMNVDPSWYAISFGIAGNAFTAPPNPLPLFSIHATQGTITTTRPILYPDREFKTYYKGRTVRDVKYLNVSTCDQAIPPMCDTQPLTVVIETNYTVPDAAVISSMTVDNSQGRLPTQGGDWVIFSGRNFVNVNVSMILFGNLRRANGAIAFRTFVSKSCVVVSSTETRCRSPVGLGSDLAVNMTMSGAFVYSEVRLELSYATPVLRNIVPSLLPTTGFSSLSDPARTVTLFGENFGAEPDYIIGRYSNDDIVQYNLQISRSNHSSMTVLVSEGCGADHSIVLQVAGQTSRSDASSGTATKFSYPKPVITTLASGSSDYTLNTLPTSNSPRIVISGRNFGPLAFPGSNVVVQPKSLFSGGTGGYFNEFLAICTKQSATPHTAMSCFLPPGVSANFTWTVEVCGQRSAASAQTTSFAPPVLSEISGVGARDAQTDGGQVFSLRGANFGDATLNPVSGSVVSGGALPPSIPLRSIRYGRVGTFEYDATINCTIDRPEIIVCRTTEGTGRDHSVFVNVGGQISNVLGPSTSNGRYAISYGAPVISSFEGAGASQANTRGNAQVTINGYNFGNTMSKVSVKYVDSMQIVSDFTGLTPGVNGEQTYNLSQASCALEPTNPHRIMHCTLAPGAGSAISWRVTVDDQISTAPTTNYAPPEITGVTLANGRSYASCDGGDEVIITGRNFGLSPLIQQIRYGPTGAEYQCTNYTYIDHETVRGVLAPGIGTGLIFTLMVADQISPPSTASISYAPPEIVAIAPESVFTKDYGSIATIIGRNFGLLDPNVEVQVAFGNTPDSTFVARTQVLRSDQALFGLTNGLQALQFRIPESLGVNRTVRVVNYRRISGAPSDSLVAAMAPQGNKAFLSFKDPVIGQISASTAQAADLPLIESLFPEFSGNIVVSQVARIIIEARGRQESFGPGPLITGGNVVRAVDWQAAQTYNPSWASYSNTAIKISNWTHSTITAYTMNKKGYVRVRIESKSQTLTSGTPQAYVQTSEGRLYDDSAPGIVSMLTVMEGGYPTRGMEVLAFEANALATTPSLNVTVGGRPCQLIKSASDRTIIAFNDVQNQIICPQVMAAFGLSDCTGMNVDSTFKWTITCLVPPGQGANQVIRIFRGDVPSPTNNQMVISYRAPTIQRIGVWNRTLGDFEMVPYYPSTMVRVPTYAGRMRLEGINFGICTSILFKVKDLVYLQVHGEEMVDFCSIGVAQDQVTTISVKANETARNDHEYVEFDVPAGEGTGRDAYIDGWYLRLVTEGQEAAAKDEPPSPVLLQYLPPRVNAISPGTGPTRGGIRINVFGDYFGSLSTPLVWLGYNDENGGRPYWTPCTNVYRRSETQLNCTLPEYTVGRAYNLFARVRVSDLAAFGGSFSYSEPQIFNISMISLNYTAADVVSFLTYSNVTTGFYNSTEIIGGEQVVIQRPVYSTVQNTSYVLQSLLHDIVTQTTYPEAAAAPPFSLASSSARATERVPLHGEPKGGYLIMLTGQDFGSGETYEPTFTCPFAVWNGCIEGGTPCNLRCDEQLTTLGEGEVPAVDVLHWSHELVIFRMPPGGGYRFFTVRVGGQGPPLERTLPDFVYHGANLTALTSKGNLNTEGGDRLFIHGLEFPLPPLRSEGSDSIIPRPAGLRNGLVYPIRTADLPQNVMEPTTYLRVNFDGRCLVSTTEPSALEATITIGDSVGCVRSGEILYAIEPGFHQRALRELDEVLANTTEYATNPQNASVSGVVSLPTGFMGFNARRASREQLLLAREAGANVTLGPGGIPLMTMVRRFIIRFPLLFISDIGSSFLSFFV
jgi:hypothetical protein